MSSGLYPRREARLNRPRAKAGDPSVQIPATVPTSLMVTVKREAAAENVSVSHVVYEALIRQCTLSHNARELGLLPIPGRLAEEELALCRSAARAAGMSLEKWAAHKLLNAALTDPTQARREAA